MSQMRRLNKTDKQGLIDDEGDFTEAQQLMCES